MYHFRRLLYTTIQFLRFIYIAKTKYRIHSPFVFELVTKVLEDDQVYEAYASIETKRTQLLANPTKINVTPLGVRKKEGIVQERSIASIAKHSLKPKKYAQLLYRIARYYKSSTILELGTSLGVTTAYFAKAMPDAKIITLEGCPVLAAQAHQLWQSLAINNSEWVEGDFEDTLAPALTALQKVDLVFIDGNHERKATLQYFEKIFPYCHNDTIVILDDIYWSSEMTEAWKEIQQHPQVTLTVDLFRMGLVFFRKENLQREHFKIPFKPFPIP